eukprot:1160921-Pelagomonas_calceolata.AAC.15
MSIWHMSFIRASSLRACSCHALTSLDVHGFLLNACTRCALTSCLPGVGHFKTLFELSGPAASMIKTLTPTQLSIVVEALGKAGAKDVDFFGQVSSNMGAFKPSELSRILWGFAAAGIEDAAFVKAVAKVRACLPGATLVL